MATDFPESRAMFVDVGKETCTVLTVIRSMPKEIGLNIICIGRTDVHLANLNDFDAMDTAYRDFLRNGRYLARTTRGTTRSCGGNRVGITCMARKDRY